MMTKFSAYADTPDLNGQPAYQVVKKWQDMFGIPLLWWGCCPGQSHQISGISGRLLSGPIHDSAFLGIQDSKQNWTVHSPDTLPGAQWDVGHLIDDSNRQGTDNQNLSGWSSIPFEAPPPRDKAPSFTIDWNTTESVYWLQLFPYIDGNGAWPVPTTLEITYQEEGMPPVTNTVDVVTTSTKPVPDWYLAPISHTTVKARRLEVRATKMQTNYFRLGEVDVGIYRPIDLAPVLTPVLESVRDSSHNKDSVYLFIDEPDNARIPADLLADYYDQFYQNLNAISPGVRVAPGGFAEDINEKFFMDYVNEFVRRITLTRTPVEEWRFHALDPTVFDEWKAIVDKSVEWVSKQNRKNQVRRGLGQKATPFILGSFGLPGAPERDTSSDSLLLQCMMSYIKNNKDISGATYYLFRYVRRGKDDKRHYFHQLLNEDYDGLTYWGLQFRTWMLGLRPLAPIMEPGRKIIFV
jgi:hypothetical protein